MAENHGGNGSCVHHANASNLDEDQDNSLSKWAPDTGGIYHHKACDTEGTGRGKQGIEKPHTAVVIGR